MLSLDSTAKHVKNQCLDSTLAERFWQKIDKNGQVPKHCPELGPCWIWLGYKKEDGRGQIGTSKGTQHAHKVSWELHNGPVPDGYCVLHHCDNMGCPNPDHLRVGTQAENIAEMIARNRSYHPSGIDYWIRRIRTQERKPPPTLEERFWAKVNKKGPMPEDCPELGPCWIWTGYRQRQGYGHMSIDGRISRVNRVAWLIQTGEDPETLAFCTSVTIRHVYVFRIFSLATIKRMLMT
jgi:hypothetical protein